MNLTPTRLKQIFVIFVAVMVGVGIFALTLPSKKDRDSKKITTSTDSTTKQQTSTIKGENESIGINDKEPIYIGTSVLVSETGFSSQQVKVLRQSVFEYILAEQLDTKQVSLDAKSIVTSINDPTNGGRDYATFNLVFDDKTTIKAKMFFDGITSTEVLLSTKDGKQVYDSGVIDGSTIK
ncbi:MAG: hypothetical protein JWM37_225 [Candidatus Saccharibacteria bacterium]|nr:hypothetical protein [Candidatus Saccharibacteria bacterium]